MAEAEDDFFLTGLDGQEEEEEEEGKEAVVSWPAELASSGVGCADLATTTRVLQCMLDGPELLAHAQCRDLRKVLGRLSTRLQARKYGGSTASEYEQKRQVKRDSEARRLRQRQLDRDYINKSQLRRARLDTLAQLLENGERAGHAALPLIPDGAASVGPPCPTAEVPAPALTASASRGDGGEQRPTAEASAQPVAEAARGERAPSPVQLHHARACYVCKVRYTELHSFYDLLCPGCAALNWQKRRFMADLSGQVVLLTGGRVKIGYQCALRLLRCGAEVVVTSRFPRDAARRFCAEADYAAFGDRLSLYGLDLRDMAALQAFLLFFAARHPRLDAIVHNACQTVRRPAAYYRPLLKLETCPVADLPKPIGAAVAADEAFRAAAQAHALGHGPGAPALPRDAPPAGAAGGKALSVRNQQTAGIRAAEKTQWPLLPEDVEEDGGEHFPEGLTDVNGQQVDLRTRNSWLLKMGEVSTPEVAEVFAINTLAPFIINSQLVPVMRRGDYVHRFIVNVSAMEGKFYRVKSACHPHTNMAKAALNMMTRTCAKELAHNDRIYMNSVDTGWINDENPLDKAARYAERHNFQTPIDEVDAASRVLDPILAAAAGAEPVFGQFLKDYRPTEW